MNFIKKVTGVGGEAEATPTPAPAPTPTPAPAPTDASGQSPAPAPASGIGFLAGAIQSVVGGGNSTSGGTAGDTAAVPGSSTAGGKTGGVVTTDASVPAGGKPQEKEGSGIGGFLSSAMGAVREEIQAEIKPSLKDDPAPATADAASASTAAPAK